MSPLEILLRLELIRRRAEYARNLQAGVEALLGSLRSEFPDAYGCDPNGSRWIGYQMPDGWEKELEEKCRRAGKKWKESEESNAMEDKLSETQDREKVLTAEEQPCPRNYYLEAMLPDYNPNGGTWFGPMPGDPPRAEMQDGFIDPRVGPAGFRDHETSRALSLRTGGLPVWLADEE